MEKRAQQKTPKQKTPKRPVLVKTTLKNLTVKTGARAAAFCGCTRTCGDSTSG